MAQSPISRCRLAAVPVGTVPKGCWFVADKLKNGAKVDYDESNQSFSYYEVDSFLHNVAEDAFFCSFRNLFNRKARKYGNV